MRTELANVRVTGVAVFADFLGPPVAVNRRAPCHSVAHGCFHAQLRVAKVTGGAPNKLAKIHTVRKNIARVLTVYNQNQAVRGTVSRRLHLESLCQRAAFLPHASLSPEMLGVHSWIFVD